MPGELGHQGAGVWGIDVGGGHRTPEGVGVGGGGGSSVGKGCGLGGAGMGCVFTTLPGAHQGGGPLCGQVGVAARQARRSRKHHLYRRAGPGGEQPPQHGPQSRRASVKDAGRHCRPGVPHSQAPPSTAPQDRAALGCKAYPTRQARRPSLAAQPPEWPWGRTESSLLGSLYSPAAVAHVLTTAPLPQRAPTTYVEPSCLVLSSCSRWGVNKTDGQRSVRLRLCGALHTGHSRT